MDRKTRIHSEQFLIVVMKNDCFDYVHPTVYRYSDAKKKAQLMAISYPEKKFVVVGVACVCKAKPVEFELTTKYSI